MLVPGLRHGGTTGHGTASLPCHLVPCLARAVPCSAVPARLDSYTGQYRPSLVVARTPLLLHTVARQSAPTPAGIGELPFRSPGGGQPPWRPAWCANEHSCAVCAPSPRHSVARRGACWSDPVLSNDGDNTVVVAAAAAATPLFPLAIRLWASAASSDACCGAGRRRWALPHDPRWQLPPAGAIPRKNLLAACSATAAATCGTPRRAGTPSPGTCLVSWDPEWPSSLNSEPRCKVRTLVLRPISLSHRPL